MKQYLFISPHLDDAVLSCGTYIYKLVQNNDKVMVATIFSGSADPMHPISPLAKEFHDRCHLNNNAMRVRRSEDKKTAKFLKTNILHLDLQECLYRHNQDGTARYLNQSDIFNTDLSIEMDTIDKVMIMLEEKLNFKDYDEIFIPLGIGRHIDHLIVRKAMETLKNQNSNINKIIYYEDVPYVCNGRDPVWKMELTKGLCSYSYPIDKHEFSVYLKAVALYKSQKHVLWFTKEIKMNELNNYFMKNDMKQYSGTLWKTVT